MLGIAAALAGCNCEQLLATKRSGTLPADSAGAPESGPAPATNPIAPPLVRLPAQVQQRIPRPAQLQVAPAAPPPAAPPSAVAPPMVPVALPDAGSGAQHAQPVPMPFVTDPARSLKLVRFPAGLRRSLDNAEPRRLDDPKAHR
jgi:hypothetical protein